MKVLRKSGIMSEENPAEISQSNEEFKIHFDEMTSISIPISLRDELEKLKIFPKEQRHRESWYSVVQRLVKEHYSVLKAKPKK
jgi:hypothetical protein